MNRCGCNPVPEPFEYTIKENSRKKINGDFKELFPIEIDLDELKEKLICEFEEILDKLECGLRPDLEFILRDLSWIYIKEKIFENNAIYIPPANYIGYADENIDDLDLNSLMLRYQENLKMTEIIQNKVWGYHLWVVSPYALHKVATDENFTFEVKMNPVAYKNGLHYYRSNSKVDICTLTYYIK